MKKQITAVIISIAILTSCQKGSTTGSGDIIATPVAAGFKINNKGGEVNEGATLSISNTSTNAASYLWDFGNGETSALKEPAYVYAHCGIYTLTLTVTDS